MLIEGFVLPLRKVEGLRNVIFDWRIFRNTFCFCRLDSAHFVWLVTLEVQHKASDGALNSSAMSEVEQLSIHLCLKHKTNQSLSERNEIVSVEVVRVVARRWKFFSQSHYI